MCCLKAEGQYVQSKILNIFNNQLSQMWCEAGIGKSSAIYYTMITDISIVGSGYSIFSFMCKAL